MTFYIFTSCLLCCWELFFNQPLKFIQVTCVVICYIITYWESSAQKVNPLCMVISSSYRIIPTGDLITFNIYSYTCAASRSFPCCFHYNVWRQKSVEESQKVPIQNPVHSLSFMLPVPYFSDLCLSLFISEKKGLRKTIYWLEQVVRLARIGDIHIWSWEHTFQVIAFTFAKVSKGAKILELLEDQCNATEI